VKILDEEVVTRCHVEFDEEETILLKLVGFLPPHAEPRARLWPTSAEITQTEVLLKQLRSTKVPGTGGVPR
jgi:hypothetical protein